MREYLENLAKAVTTEEYVATVEVNHNKPNVDVYGISICSTHGSVAPFIAEAMLSDDFDEDISFIKDVIANTDFSLNGSDLVSDLKRSMYEVRPRVVKSEGNEEIKKLYIGREVLDLYVYYYIPVDAIATDDFQNVNVTYSLAETLGILEEDMYNVALKNLKKDVCKCTVLGSMPVLSNENKTFGGAQILNTEAFRECGQDLVIIPSSIHELIVMPKDILPEDILKEMIGDVNKSEVLPQEVLSDHPYYYNYAKDCVEM